jgi:hypothetical protein
VNGPQLTFPPLITQIDGAVWLAIDHVTPDPGGNGSVSVTPLAAPFPLFVSVITNPIGDPALTELAYAVLVMVRLGGQLTVSTAVADPLPPLELV